MLSGLSGKKRATPLVRPAPGTLPYDRHFQSKIVRTLYQDADFAFTLASHMSPDVFDSKPHRWVVAQIFKHAEKYGAHVTADAMEAYLDRAVTYGYFRKQEVDDVVDVVEKLDKPVADRTWVKDEVFNFIKSVKLKESVLSAAQSYEDGKLEDADKVLADYLNFSETPRGLGHFFLRDVGKRLKRRKHYVANGIPTDTPLDRFMHPGGLPPKHLGVVVAPPGRGKTLSLVHFGRAAVMSNCQVLYVTLELSEEQIEDRFDAAFSNLYIQQLVSKRRETKHIIRRLQKKFREALVIKEFSGGTLTVSGLRSYLRQLERVAFYPDMILVDYADYLVPSRHYDDVYEELGLVYTELRALAKETNTAIWTASQGNRGSVNAKVVDIASMADSFKKAMVADVVIGFSQTDKERRQKLARLYMAKSRVGPADHEVNIKVSGGKQRLIATNQQQMAA